LAVDVCNDVMRNEAVHSQLILVSSLGSFEVAIDALLQAPLQVSLRRDIDCCLCSRDLEIMRGPRCLTP
jgi:hypothetical protein